jgi:hypothetical protein
MPENDNKLTKLSYNQLHNLLTRSPILEGGEAEAFATALRDVPLYQNEARLQMLHSRAVLSRMRLTADFEEALILSHVQESMPSFYLSLTLRQVFAQGLVVAAMLNPTLAVLRRGLARAFKLPSFHNCPVLQRAAADLLLEGVLNSETPQQAGEFLNQFCKLPGVAYSADLQKIQEQATREAKRAGRDPIVKIDLNQKLAKPVKMVGKLLGMGDFRMKVKLCGLEYYDEVRVRVPAFNEKAARKVAQQFIKDFLKEQSGPDEAKSAKIVEMYPPGSKWESGRHPVLKLK